MLTFQPFATSIAFFLIILLWSGTSFSLNQNSRLSLPPRQRNGIDGYAPVAQLQHRTRNLPLVLKSSKEEQFFATDVVEPEVNAEELQVAVAAENASKLRTAASLFDYDSTYVLFASAVIGVLSGFAVAMFKLSIEALRESVYGNAFAENVVWWLIPALGGLGVGLLAKTGEFAPGLLGTANEIDDLSLNVKEDLRFKNAGRFLRKPLAAIITLGSGCSLGPEGPSVEIGMTMSRLCMPPSIQRSDMQPRGFEEIAFSCQREPPPVWRQASTLPLLVSFLRWKFYNKISHLLPFLVVPAVLSPKTKIPRGNSKSNRTTLPQVLDRSQPF
jgi:hypothetical protein